MVNKTDVINALWGAKKFLASPKGNTEYFRSEEANELGRVLDDINLENKEDGVLVYVGNIVYHEHIYKDCEVITPRTISAIGLATDFLTENTRSFRSPIVVNVMIFRTEMKDYKSRVFDNIFDKDAYIWWLLTEPEGYMNTAGNYASTFSLEAMECFEVLLKENKLTEIKRD